MKRLYIHGTSYQSGMDIMVFHGNCGVRPIRSWSCSEYDKVYVRCLSDVNMVGEKFGGLDCSTREEFLESVFAQTIENANINAAMQNQQDNDKTILHIFTIDDQDIEVDTSAPNEFLNVDELGFTDAEQLLMDVLHDDERIFEITQEYNESAVESAKSQYKFLMKMKEVEDKEL